MAPRVMKKMRAAAVAVLPLEMKAAKARPDAALKGAKGQGSKAAKAAALVCGEISDTAKVSVKDTRAVMDAVRQVGTRHLRTTGTFRVPAMVSFRVVSKAARPAKKKVMFGKTVHCAEKPASQVVKAAPMKQLRDAVTEG